MQRLVGAFCAFCKEEVIVTYCTTLSNIAYMYAEDRGTDSSILIFSRGARAVSGGGEEV